MNEDDYESPLTGDEMALAHWGFTVDIAEREGSGSNSGEFLLRSDGTLLRRLGWDLYIDGVTTWRFEAWHPVREWSGVADPSVLFDWLTARGYVLFPPTTTPVDRRVSEPVPGSFGALQPLRHPV